MRARSWVVVAAVMISGCAGTSPSPHLVRIVIAGDAATTGVVPVTATLGNGSAGVSFEVQLANGSTMQAPGGAARILLSPGPGHLTITNDGSGEMHTSLSLVGSGCGAIFTSSSHHERNATRVGIDAGISPSEPFQEYELDAPCAGRLILLWSFG